MDAIQRQLRERKMDCFYLLMQVELRLLYPAVVLSPRICRTETHCQHWTALTSPLWQLNFKAIWKNGLLLPNKAGFGTITIRTYQTEVTLWRPFDARTAEAR